MQIFAVGIYGGTSIERDTMEKQPLNGRCETLHEKKLKSLPTLRLQTSRLYLAQRITFCQEQELNLENKASPIVAQPPETLFLLISTILETLIRSEND